MVTLKQFQKLTDKYNKAKREASTINFPSVSRVIVIGDQSQLDAERDKIAQAMQNKMALLEKEKEIEEALSAEESCTGYFNLTYTCSKCGEAATKKNENLYRDIDFKNLLCPDCTATEENKEQAKLIEGATDIHAVYNESHELIEVVFKKDGEAHVVSAEGSGGDYIPLTVEKV